MSEESLPGSNALEIIYNIIESKSITHRHVS